MNVKSRPFRILVLLVVLLAQSFASSARVSAQAPKTNRLTLEALGTNDLSLRGLYGTAQVFIPFQSNWVITQDIQATVIYTASPILTREQTTLTISANDQNVFSLHPLADGQEHSFSFVIPAGLLHTAKFLLLRFDGYLRLTTNPCEETNNPGQWLTISKRSDLSLVGDENRGTPSLENLTGELIVQHALGPTPPLVFVLPDTWNSTELSTLALVAARLGENIGGKLPAFKAVTVSNLTPDLQTNANLIVIGHPDNMLSLPRPVAAAFKDSPARAATTNQIATPAATATASTISTVPTNEPSIQLVNSPWNAARRVLIITGKSDDDLIRAGQIFADTDSFSLLKGQAQTIASLSTLPLKGDQPRAWQTNLTTFAQLGTSDTTVIGTGVFDQYFTYRLPPGWMLDPGAQLTLDVAFSPALQTDHSYVSVYINGVFVGNISARGSDAGKNMLATFSLPVDKIQLLQSGGATQNLALQFSVSNDVSQNICEPLLSNAVWTRINATSSIKTPHHNRSWPDLQALPYPFLKNDGAAPLLIALPNNPTMAYVQDALNLSALLGQLASSDMDLRIAQASEILQQKSTDANLIVLGNEGDQPLITSLGAGEMPIADRSVVAAINNPDFGVLREIASPWNPQRAVLLVYSVSSAGYTNAITALLQSVPPVLQSGTVAIVGAGQAPRVIYRTAQSTPPPAPTPVTISTHQEGKGGPSGSISGPFKQ